MPDQLDLLTWHQIHETYNGDYLGAARHAARQLLETRDCITINDVRALCPVPDGLDPRVLGAVFRHADFEGTGEYVRSARGECHNRPIQKFMFSNKYLIHQGREAA